MSDKHRKSVGQWLAHNFEWKIPVYQRHYAWDAGEEAGTIDLFWETCERQIRERLAGKKPDPHYFGAILVDETIQEDRFDEKKIFNVVDGQQRLTTITLALLALIKVAKKNGIGDKIVAKTNEYILSDTTTYAPKIQPINFDNGQFRHVLFQSYGELPNVEKLDIDDENAKQSKVVKTHRFFAGRFAKLIGEVGDDRIEEVCNAILETLTKGFDIVLILLKETDEAQIVFESINNTARPLTTFDLIRNYIFYRAAKQEQNDKKLFESRLWQQLENPFWEGKADGRKTGWNTHIEAYIARMLVAKMKGSQFLYNRTEIVRTYKDFVESNEFANIETEIKSVSEYTEIYKHLMNEPAQHQLGDKFKLGVFSHSVWENKDFYPLLFIVLTGTATLDEKQNMVGMLESYVIRRYAGNYTTAHYNLFIAELCREVDNTITPRCLRDLLLHSKKDSNKFPTDVEVERGCINEKFYRGGKIKNYIFEQLENEMKPLTEVEINKGLTVDHVLPQKWETTQWIKDLGITADNSDGKLFSINLRMHTIGNLTLMTKEENSSKGNSPFSNVKNIFSESRLKMNNEIAKETQWDETTIHARSKRMAASICKRWTDTIQS